MNDADHWIYFDGPEPARVRELLDPLRDLGTMTPEDEARVECALLARLDADVRSADAHGGAAARAGADRWEREGQEIDAPRQRMTPVEVEEAEAPAVAPPDTPDTSTAPSLPARPLPRPPAHLAGTATALDLPPDVWKERGKLPFKPPDQIPPVTRAPKTLQVPVMRSGLAETVPVGDDSILKAVAALPFLGNTVGAGIVPFPRLTLEEYASLCAELEVKPERSPELLIKYHVLSNAGHRALDEHWRKHLADHPDRRAEFERALTAFTAYVRIARG